MITRDELLKIVTTHPNYSQARDVLKHYNTEFTLFSCDNDLVDKVVFLHLEGKKDDLLELVGHIKTANSIEQDIHVIMTKANGDKQKDVARNEFFKAFEDPNTTERLFIMLGETGVGKSMYMENNYPDIMTVVCTPIEDPYSIMFSLENKGEGFKPYPTPFNLAMRNGEPVYFDEGSELNQAMRMFVQGITDEKKRIMVGSEMVEIGKGFKIMMTLNPPSQTDEREPFGDALLGRSVGHVMEMTDNLLCERIGCPKDWVFAVRKLWNHIRQSGMIDMRDLDFRIYKSFWKYDFESQLQYRCSLGDVSNIKEFAKIRETGEYQSMLKKINTLKATHLKYNE